MTTYALLKAKISKMENLDKAEEYITRMYNNELLTASDFSRLDLWIMDEKTKREYYV